MLLDWPGDMKLKMCAGKQTDPRTDPQDFRGQMIGGEKAAQSCCSLCGLPLAALSSSYFFFLQMYQLIMLSGNLKCGGHGSLLGHAVQQCPGKDSQRCLCGDVACGVVKSNWGH